MTQSCVPTPSGSTKLTTDAVAAISKKAFSKTTPLHSHTCQVTRTTILLYKVLSVAHFEVQLQELKGVPNFKAHGLYQNISTIFSWPESGFHILQNQFPSAGISLIGSLRTLLIITCLTEDNANFPYLAFITRAEERHTQGFQFK